MAEEIEPIEEEPVALAEEKEEEIKEEPVALEEKKQEAQKVLSVKVKEEKKSLNVVKKGSNILSWKEQLQIIKEEIENKPDSLKEEIDLDPKVTFSLESKVSKVDKNNKNSSKDENLDFSTEVAQKDEEEFIEEISIDRSQQEFLKMMEDNNVICIAPPGHGKTATAIESISYYLKFSNYTKPKNIFFLSFTNAAVNEALFRLKSIQDGPLVQCYTVDSFAGKLNQLVRENTGLKFPTNTYDENMIAATKFIQGVADKDSKDCVQGFIDQTIDLLIIDETQDINNLRFDFIKSLLRRINKECRVIVFGDHLQEIYSFQENNNNKGTLLNYLKENKTHLNFKIHSLKTNHRIKNKNLLSTYEFARKNYEDEISIKEKNNNLKKHLKDLYSGSIVDTKNKKQKTTVYLFRRNIDVISHVLSRYKNFKKTSFRIRSLHEIINPFFAFIFRNFPQKEKLKLDDLWQEIFDFDIERFEALYKINPGEFVDSIDYFFGDENNCLDLKKIEEDIRFRQMPECFKTRKWGLGKNIFSSIHSYKGRESENVVLNMQSNALQGRSEKLNEDEYRIYYVGLTRAKKNLQYTEFVSEKVDYKKFLNKREFIPSYNGIFIGRKGDVIWSNLPERYLNDMSQKWFSKHPNEIIELEIIYNDKSLKEPSFDILTKKTGIYIGCLSEPLAKNIRFQFSDYMPPRFGNIFMVGTTTALIEDFLPREEDNKKIVEINKNIENKPKIIFYPNVAGILSPKV